MKNFKEKMRRKIQVEHDEGADYRFWSRFKKEGAKPPLLYRAWAPVFMILLCAVLGVSIYHSPETNQKMLSLKTEQKTEQKTEEKTELERILELDRESEELFAEINYGIENDEDAGAYLFL